MLGGRCIFGMFSLAVLGDLHREGPASLASWAEWLLLMLEEASADANSFTVMTPGDETTA